jgi:hypothetical protein
MLVLCAVSAAAQEPATSFPDLRGRLPLGSTIVVIDDAGRRTIGRITEISETTLRVLVDGNVRAFSAPEVTRVQQRRGDPLWNGLLIGAAAGSGYGIYWYFRDPNECGGTVCGQDLAMGAGVGAAIGLAIDAVTVYVSPGAGAQGGSTPTRGAVRRAVRAAVRIRW